MTHHRTTARLVLADRKVFTGTSFGATGTTLGEAVFTTAMTGYQETMTDPSYHRQIVVATAPQIGNTGWNDEDDESRGSRIWVAGLVIRDLSAQVSSWRATRSLEDEMIAQNIIGIAGVDTRTIVRHLRNFGSISAGIFSGAAADQPVEKLVDIVRSQPAMAGLDLAEQVSTTEPYIVEPIGEHKFTVVAYDMGIKTNTPRNFAHRGIRTIVVPANTPYADIAAYNPDGVFVSNGPGDPATADTMVGIVRDILAAKIPFFGICFGNQILGRALGLGTYKMKFGHRGINVPMKGMSSMMFQENLDNALCRTTIPTLGNSTLLPPSGDHVFKGTTEQVGIFTDKDIASHLYRLNMFRITVQRYTGDIVESRFLGDIPRIGDDSPCMCRKISKFKITQWFYDMEVMKFDVLLQAKCHDNLHC